MHESGDEVEQLPFQTQYRRGFAYLFVGVLLLYKAIVFGVLRPRISAVEYVPIFMVIAYISDILSFPDLVWGALYVGFPLGGLVLFVWGCRLIVQSVKQGKLPRQVAGAVDQRIPTHHSA